MAPNATTQSAHSSDQTTIDKNAVTAHFLAKFTDLQSRFDAPTDVFESKGKRFLETAIGRFVDRKEPITIVLPGFPTKTPNHGGKVLGPLPDRAEELALSRLENFCTSIEEMYPIGCKVTIFSDGRVFGDLVGASLENIRAYKNGLKALVDDAGHTHIQFDGLENYTKTDDPVQEVLERFHINQMDMDARIQNEPDVGNNFRSFSQFMERDMADRWEGKSEAEMRKGCDEVARKMMLRNVGFSSLVAEEYAHAVRVSIHCYNNAGPKFGIHLLPSKRMDTPRTPWHSVICEDIDGTVHAMDLKDVNTDKYDLPKGVAQWAPLNVQLIRTHMFIIAQAMEGFPAPSIMDVPRDAIRHLVLKYGVVTLRGFKQDDDFETATERWGDVLQWPKGTFDEDAEFVTETLQERLYSEEFAHWHQWVKGEFVVMDNISQLHARTVLGMGGRHMRRIHFN
eukprot:jgi/Phyca11/19312/fgenesh1_pg.PHYCAscaffold_47_\